MRKRRSLGDTLWGIFSMFFGPAVLLFALNYWYNYEVNTAYPTWSKEKQQQWDYNMHRYDGMGDGEILKQNAKELANKLERILPWK